MNLNLMFFLFFSSFLFSQELNLILDSKENFKFIQESKNISFRKDKRGVLGVFLERNKNSFDLNNVDLNLEISDENKFLDTSENYFVDGYTANVFKDFNNISNNVLVFYSSQNPVKFRPLTKKAFFASNNIISDFTINLWVYRTTSTTGEVILNWNGYLNTNNTWMNQFIRFETEDENFVWVLNNVFLNKNKPLKVKIKSNDKFVPKEWHLHTLRYKQKDGLLEYLIDSSPQAIKYITEDKKDNAGYLINIGNFIDFSLGKYFTGAVDGLQIYRSFENPSVSYFSKKMGYIISEPIKLSSNYVQILSIAFDDKEPKDTDIVYYYRTDDNIFYETNSDGSVKKNIRGAWINFNPKVGLPKTIISKYIQIKIELYPDGTALYSPSFYSAVISYIPEVISSPPIIIKVIPGSEEIYFEWTPVIDRNIKGYYVYFGISPNNYHAKFKNLSSPIDVGNQNFYRLKGLENGKLYYIRIAAYNLDKGVSESSFSREITARPMEIFKNYD